MLEHSKACVCTGEFRKPHACPGQETCSEKTWEVHKCGDMADLQDLCNQEVKAEIELSGKIDFKSKKITADNGV